MNLLIVDDIPTNLKLLRVQLEAEGHAVFEAADGVEALALLEREPVDAVISDILMPRMDGYRLCHEIRKHPRLRDLPVIIYTSTYTSPGDAQLAHDVGAHRYITKPASVETLLAALREVITQPHPPVRPGAMPELEVLKEYNERLVAKLEEKNLELMAAQEKLILQATAMTTAANAIIIADHTGKMIWVNAAFTTMTGYSAAEALGQTPRLLKSGHHDAAFYRDFWQTISSGQTWRSEFTNRRKDGSLYHDEHTVTPVCDAEGKITHYIGILHDITARKQAEAELRASETRYRELFENAHDLIQCVSADGHFVYVNPAWRQALGYTEAEVATLTMQDIIHPGSRAHCLERFGRLLSGQPVGVVEAEFITKDGRTLFVEGTASGECLGEKQGVARCFFRDITERKQAEAEAQILTQRLVLATEAASIGVWDWDLKTDQWYATPVYFTMLGYDPEENPSRERWIERVHPADRAMVAGRIQDVLAGITTHYEYEARIRHADGSYRWVHVSGRVLAVDEQGKATRMIGVRMDITDQKRAEAERLWMARQRQLLLDSTGEGIYGMDLAGRCTLLNRAGAEMLGWRPEEALGKNIHELIHHHRPDGSPYPVEECPIIRAFRKGEPCRVDTEVFFRQDGTFFPVDYSSHPIREDGVITGAVVAFSDSTARKQLEAQFLRAQRMESIGSLAGGIAHDLNNALAPIVMASEFLKMTCKDPEAGVVLDTIYESAKRGAGMVKQILTFARGSEGDRGVVQPKHLVKEMIDIARHTFSKAIQIRTDVATETWTLLGNPTQLHQILLNLCVNARDAMPNGGTLSLATGNVHLDAFCSQLSPDAKPGCYVLLTVSDTGTGMPPEVKARIFDAFFTTKEPGKGTGLGLSTVLSIAKDHGGFLTVESEVGRGTTFKVYLPAQETTAGATAEAAPPTLPMGQGELILVVDDEAAIRSIAQQTLQAFGYRVVTAADGAQAVVICAQHLAELQLLVTDIAMPIMDGKATARAIRTLVPRLPIIVASGSGSLADPAAQQALDVHGFLHKPYSAEDLLRTVHAVLHGRDTP